MDNIRTRSKNRVNSESTSSSIESTVDQTSSEVTVADTPADSENIPEATVIIEEIKSKENIMYKIREESNENGENATIIEIPTVNAGETVSREAVDEKQSEMPQENEVTQESSEEQELQIAVEAEEAKTETVMEGNKDEANQIEQKSNESKQTEQKSQSTVKSKRRKRSQSELLALDTPIDIVSVKNENDVNLTRSRYGRIQKSKPNPEMVSFDVPKRRSSLKNGEKSMHSSLEESKSDENKDSRVVTSAKSVNFVNSSPEKETDAIKKAKSAKAPTTPLTPRSALKSPIIKNQKEAMKSAKSKGLESPKKKSISPKNERKSILLTSSTDNIQICDRETLTTIPDKEGDYMVGDLLWSKLPGYPWWPCMISIDPVLGSYSKIGGTSYKAERVYHVQYFGTQPLRGYTMPGMTMPFNGRREYELNLDRVKNSPVAQKSQRSKLLARFSIKSQFKKDWDIAVDEAEVARAMSREQRVKELTFDYVYNNKSPNANKRISSSPISVDPAKKQKKSEDIYDFDDTNDETFEKNTSPPLFLFSQKREGKKGEFSVYLSRQKSLTKQQNPNLSDAEVENLLKRNWELLSEDLKAKYAPPSRPKMSTTPKITKPPKPDKTPKSSLKMKIRSKVDVKNDKIQHSIKEEKPKPSVDSSDEEGALVIAEPMQAKKKTRKSIVKTPPHSAKIPLRRTKNLSQHEDSNEIKAEKPEESPVAKKRSEEPNAKITPVEINALPNESEKLDRKLLDFPSSATSITLSVAAESSDETGTSEDASSLSEMELTETTKLATEKICAKCNEEVKDAICCTGPCLQAFHKECLSLKENENSYTSAGSVTISSSYIICPEHQEAKKGKNEKHINVTWCFSCNTGGSLICCERCPAAFHSSCLDTEPPESSFYCSDCVSRKQLHYGDIVWVKLGVYRWWPGRVCHPKNVPDNVMNLQHATGEFPVYFFGSHDYYWVHKGRTFLFVEGDSTKNVTVGGSKSLSKSFKLAMKEAVEAYNLWQEAKRTILQLKTSKPPPYTHIRSNKPVPGKQQPIATTDKAHNRCDCDPNSPYPCSSDVGCFNRLLMFECNSSICSAGEKCCNQRFRKREYVKCVPFKTESRGWGLKTIHDIKKHQFVIEYVGELIDEAECERRLNKMIASNETNFYFLTIDKDTIIDAGPKGNLARFMNHSCTPNCETQKWVVNGVTRVGLFALHDIPAGSELTFNYNLDCCGNEKTKCMCSSKNCSGFIGVRPTKAVGEEINKKMANGGNKKRRVKKERNAKDYESLHDDECFRCGEGGELVMCDRKSCPKSFHKECLNLKEIPRGRWECPWHHCDVCGKQATSLCSYCPTSYCNEHCTSEKLKELPDGRFLCYEHIGDPLEGICEELPSQENAEEEQEEEEGEIKTQAAAAEKQSEKINETIDAKKEDNKSTNGTIVQSEQNRDF
ncbi:histone-lysine N-methyltransferase NSD2-like isoform X2 [Dinothrombium tinctorium]|uniref:Histone-lysine N-methyltransferase NSD2-like isoform X2 n=1 Tax=Dinothrombium tinctorium TaxID=1965070 RepID=A0A443RB55_9ACAR|nr:histone-lysine N-methyltransferase NSD2-like isoform X2 [Dinothrombium tinctorium]RWS12650.1 histone-lysine N-methyltransferase NSD2-like isoform X2 [Dinothrombium tinctorium]